MTPERWHQVEELYHLALKLTESERDGFLRETCGGDEPLRSEVQSLLMRGGSDHSFFDRFGGGDAARILAGMHSLPRRQPPASVLRICFCPEPATSGFRY
jgi:hypothetical protein